MPGTESASAVYRDIDLWPTPAVCAAILETQHAALAAIAPALPAIATAADAVAAKMALGGRMIYAGAGSSGLLAQVDALEMPGTYGLPPTRLPVLLAGGTAALTDIPSGAEDDAEAGTADVEAIAATPDDALVALSVSGATPYAVAALHRARVRGALTIGIAGNPGTPLLAAADHAILIETPPEVIAGSTRMGAGTAQKCVLNMLSTLIGLRLGHGFAGLMVNMQPDNAKLRTRAVAIVAAAAEVDPARAEAALAGARDIKTAILLCRGAADPGAAQAALAAAGGDLRRALAAISQP